MKRRLPEYGVRTLQTDDGLNLPALEKGQLVLDLHQEPSHDAADFLVWDGNRLAYEHIVAYPNWPGPLTLITGPAKSGKSHLAGIWAKAAGARQADGERLEKMAREGGQQPVLVENADQYAVYEHGLFHLLNQSMRDRRPLLMTARSPVEQWGLQTDDAKSRVRLAAQFAVEDADDTQLSQMFVKLFGDRQVSIDPRIVSYLVPRMERSPQEAVALVTLIDEIALSRRSPVSRSIAAEALALREKMRSSESAYSEDGAENG